jgi:hypothetical protein
MLNGGGDTSITISGTRLSNLNSIAGRQTRDELRRHCDAILENYAALALAHPPHRFLCSLAARDKAAQQQPSPCAAQQSSGSLPREIHVPRAGRHRPLPGRRCQRCQRI